MKAKRKNLGDTLKLHVRNQMSLYLFITVLFMMGVVFGAVVVNTLSPAQKEGLLEYLGYFFRGLEQNTIAEPQIAFQHSMGDHLRNLGLMWMLGLSIIGIPLILILIFLKGCDRFYGRFSGQPALLAGIMVCLFVGGSPEFAGGSRHDHHGGLRNPFFPPAGEKPADFPTGKHLSGVSRLFRPGDGDGGGVGVCLPL